jgi:hypothetical protein
MVEDLIGIVGDTLPRGAIRDVSFFFGKNALGLSLILCDSGVIQWPSYS